METAIAICSTGCRYYSLSYGFDVCTRDTNELLYPPYCYDRIDDMGDSCMHGLTVEKIESLRESELEKMAER